MHELSIARAIVDAAARHAGGRRVVQVRLRVGALRQVVPETLTFAFDLAARGSVCEGARLEQELIPARLRCCGRSWKLERPDFRCPTCGGAAEPVGGDELEIESIELEEAACTA
jgi:hydrogenase nickel incorporation protein HypA/HybF